MACRRMVYFLTKIRKDAVALVKLTMTGLTNKWRQVGVTVHRNAEEPLKV